jgi:hypothetical protein
MSPAVIVNTCGGGGGIVVTVVGGGSVVDGGGGSVVAGDVTGVVTGSCVVGGTVGGAVLGGGGRVSVGPTSVRITWAPIVTSVEAVVDVVAVLVGGPVVTAQPDKQAPPGPASVGVVPPGINVVGLATWRADCGSAIT